ncbi:MAG TPA: ATP-binding cassette domain-containing protein [Candidatus Dormibacteraeota bacterium]|nr:ATP-binding cassette domain-containing protein [Candidatus Dormibacteraeota bacterium]
MPDNILEIDRVTHAFGGLKAVDGCTFSVKRGSITALIGPNGAGKTTLVNLVAGALKCRIGSIVFDGAVISGRPSFQIGQRGLIRTFQISRELGNLTVLENLLVVVPHQRGEGLLNTIFRPAIGRNETRINVAKALGVLDTFRLYGHRDEYAKNLSGGQKRLLELARAVMAEPKLLLLDEPMTSINPALVAQIAVRFQALRDAGITLLMVEHNLSAVDEVCDDVVVMAEGRALARGRLAELRLNEAVVRAYLGGVHANRPAG